LFFVDYNLNSILLFASCTPFKFYIGMSCFQPVTVKVQHVQCAVIMQRWRSSAIILTFEQYRSSAQIVQWVTFSRLYYCFVCMPSHPLLLPLSRIETSFMH